MHLSTRAINLTAAICLIAPLALCELGSRYLIHLTH